MDMTAYSPPPTDEEWRALHGAAAKVKELAPWRWMLEDDLFGVDDPETGERGYVSVMGNRGEHMGISLYLGDAAVDAFWNFQFFGDELPVEALLVIPQLQISWEDRAQLTDKDRAQLKALGLKFRGRGAWPLARATKPGHLPWYVDGAQVRLLTHALEQLLVIAARLRENEEALVPPPDFDDERDSYLYRTRGDDGIWRDEWRYLDPAEIEAVVPVTLDRDLLAAIAAKQLRKELRLEYAVVMLPMPTAGERGEAPFLPFVALMVEARSGMIVGMQMLNPVPSLEAMQRSIPDDLLDQLKALNFRPQKLTVADERLAARISAPLKEAGITVVHGPTPSLEEAIDQVFNMMGGRARGGRPFGER